MAKKKKTKKQNKTPSRPATRPKSKKGATTQATKGARKARKTPRTRTREGQARGKAGPLGIGTLHVDFLTYKSSQVQKFYGEFLELKTEYRDMDGVDYLLVRTSSTSSVGFMPPHPDMRGEQPAPREPALYFMVEDVDRAYRYLVGKGAAFARPPETMPWGHRILVTTDPEGRTVIIAGKVDTED